MILDLFPITILKTKINYTVEQQNLFLKECKSFNFVSTSPDIELNKMYSDVSSDKYIFLNKVFKQLKKDITKEVNHFTKNILKYNDKFIDTTSWLTRTKTNCKSDFHFHNNSMISSVFYLSAIKDTFVINNVVQQGFECIPYEWTKQNCKETILTVETGDLIVFPSYLKHAIGLNKENKIRYSLASNFIPVGKFGKNDSELHIKKVC